MLPLKSRMPLEYRVLHLQKGRQVEDELDGPNGACENDEVELNEAYEVDEAELKEAYVELKEAYEVEELSEACEIDEVGVLQTSSF